MKTTRKRKPAEPKYSSITRMESFGRYRQLGCHGQRIGTGPITATIACATA